MKFRYVIIEVECRQLGASAHGRFFYNSFVISYYLSKQIRKIQFETDGTFDGVCIDIGGNNPENAIFNRYLLVNVPFEPDIYYNPNEEERLIYYIQLIKRGLGEARRYKAIPYDELIRLCDELVAQNFTMRWNFRNLRIPEYNLRVSFNCKLDPNDFVLSLSASNLKTKAILCEGRVARTFPDCDHFTMISKKMRVEDGYIVIPNKSGRDIISIDLEGLAKGELYVVFLPAPAGYSRERIEYWNEFQSWLQYDNNDFKH